MRIDSSRAVKTGYCPARSPGRPLPGGVQQPRLPLNRGARVLPLRRWCCDRVLELRIVLMEPGRRSRARVETKVRLIEEPVDQRVPALRLRMPCARKHRQQYHQASDAHARTPAWRQLLLANHWNLQRSRLVQLRPGFLARHHKVVFLLTAAATLPPAASILYFASSRDMPGKVPVRTKSDRSAGPPSLACRVFERKVGLSAARQEADSAARERTHRCSPRPSARPPAPPAVRRYGRRNLLHGCRNVPPEVPPCARRRSGFPAPLITRGIGREARMVDIADHIRGGLRPHAVQLASCSTVRSYRSATLFTSPLSTS